MPTCASSKSPKDSALFTTFFMVFGITTLTACLLVSPLPQNVSRTGVTEVAVGLEGVYHMDNIGIWWTTKERHDARSSPGASRKNRCHIQYVKVRVWERRGNVSLSHDVDVSWWHESRSRQNKSYAGHERSNECKWTQVPWYGEAVRESSHPMWLKKTNHEELSKNNKWFWGHKQQRAFCSLHCEPVLYDPNMQPKISAESSSYGLGALMPQKHGVIWSPVTYASRLLTDTKQRYVKQEIQILALIRANERLGD